MKKYNVCIVGGGSTYTLGFLKSFARMQEEFPLNKLVLFDIDEKRQEPIGKFGDILFGEKMPELDFSYTTDEEEAYKDMDFIFMQMRAGGLEMRAKDEHIPLSMGLIGQETCGAGGMAYGLRSCVDMIKAIHAIRKYSPDAWILNYSNPAAIVAEALRREFPSDHRILNICDQPENVVRSCSRLLGCDWEDLDPVYFGLNHYGWFTHIYDKATGEDLLPKIKELIKVNGFLPQDAEQRDQSWLDTYGMVQTIMNDFPDYLPNTYDQYYLYPDYKASHLDPNFTRADEVMAGREKRVFKECAEIIKEGKLGEKLENISDAHAEMMIKVAEAIAFNKNNRHILIVENNGAIANMQDDAMVEVVCELGINGPRPMRVGNIPQFYLGLLVNQVSSEKLLVDAYFEKSYNKALQAFTINRLVNDAKGFKVTATLSGQGSQNTQVSIPALNSAKAKTMSGKTIRVSWSVSGTASGYKIYRKSNGGSYKLVKTIADGSVLSWTDTGVKKGTYYAYKVVPYIVSGSTIDGSQATTSSVKLTGSLAKVTGVKATKKKSYNTVSWKKNSLATGYKVYRKTGSGSYKLVKTTSSTSYKDRSVKKGKKYTYKIKAYYKNYTYSAKKKKYTYKTVYSKYSKTISVKR